MHARDWAYLGFIRVGLVRDNSISAVFLLITDFQTVIHWAKAMLSELSLRFGSGGSVSLRGFREEFRRSLVRLLV